MNVDVIRRLLAIAELPRDPYAVAQVAATLLGVDGNDRFALGHYARALTELKMLGAAQRVLRLEASGVGVVPWASRARRFQANVRALDAKDAIGAAAVREAGANLPGFELHQAGDGNFHVLDLQRPVHAGWVSPLENHKAAISLWQFDRATMAAPPPVVFQGLGFGWLFLHVLATTERTFVNYSCAAHVVEGDPLGLAMVFHMHDLREAIGHPRTHWYVRDGGEAALGAFAEKISRDQSLTIPQQFIRCAIRPAPALGLEEAVKRAAEERGRRHERNVAAAADYYAGKDAGYWAGRFEKALGGRSAEKLRVLGITSRHTTVLQYSMAEMQAAVTAKFGGGEGRCEFRIALEPDDHSFENPFREIIAEFKPDLIFQISRMRYENMGLPKSVPFLCWDQDNLGCMRTAEATASLDALTFVAGHGAVSGFTTLEWPRENCIFVHPAGATVRYHDGPVGREVRERYACDFSYVSNASGSVEALGEQLRIRWERQAAWRALLDAAMHLVSAESDAGATWDYVSLKNLVRRMAGEQGLFFDPELWPEITADLHVFADRCFRHSTLNWVSEWCKANGKTLRLYGRGWENHATLGMHAAGIAEPGEQVRGIYQATRINLQLMEPGFIHSRALDGLAAGGFFLTRGTPTDGLGSPAVRTLHELGRYTVEHRIGSDEELEAVEDRRVREMVAAARAYYLRHEVRDSLWRSLQVWAEAPAAALYFPRLEAITFRDAKSFAALAERYLGAGLERAALAAEMRRIVEEKFSYHAHWGVFMEAVRKGLASYAGGTGWDVRRNVIGVAAGNLRAAEAHAVIAGG